MTAVTLEGESQTYVAFREILKEYYIAIILEYCGVGFYMYLCIYVCECVCVPSAVQ